MLSRTSSRPVHAAPLQHVRTLKRVLAYPREYRPVVPGKTGEKDHSSWFRRAIQAWLGPKNVRGEYYRNKYYYPPQNHTPNYIVRDGEPVGHIPSEQQVLSRRPLPFDRNPAVHPFPDNLQCQTSSMISHDMKLNIYEDSTVKNMRSQEIAQKYGIKVTRVEAIIRLHEIEQTWHQNDKIHPEIAKFADVMYKMFPLYNPTSHAENLTEIPTPSRTLHQRFLTISESEPFGPVDAAGLFDLEPASDTLKNLTEIQDHSHPDISTHKVIVGLQKLGDRNVFKFTPSKSGEVGFRYGASRRDQKKNRAVGFDRVGRMVNV